MRITSKLWDKKSAINGKDAAFLGEYFKKDNGNDDRVLLLYDGVICRIEYVDDSFFTVAEKGRMAEIMSGGTSREEAIAETWREKAEKEHEDGERRAAEEAARQKESENKLAQVEADVLYVAIMAGVEL